MTLAARFSSLGRVTAWSVRLLSRWYRFDQPRYNTAGLLISAIRAEAARPGRETVDTRPVSAGR